MLEENGITTRETSWHQLEVCDIPDDTYKRALAGCESPSFRCRKVCVAVMRLY